MSIASYCYRFYSISFIISIGLLSSSFVFTESNSRVFNLEKAVKQEIIENLFSSQQNLLSASPTVLLPHSPKELNLTEGQSTSPDVNLLDRLSSSTLFGREIMRQMFLESPSYAMNKENALARQAALKEIISKPAELTELFKSFSTINASTDAFLIGWSATNPFNQATNDILSGLANFTGSQQSPYMLESFRIMLLSTYWMGNGAAYLTSIGIPLFALHQLILSPLKLERYRNRPLSDGIFITQLGALFVTIAGAADWTWFNKIAPSLRNQEEVSSDLCALMKKVSAVFKHAESVYTWVKETKHVAKALPHLHDLEKIATCSEELSPEVRNLLQELKESTFDDQEAPYTNMGRVRACYASFLAVKDQLVPFMKALGEIDALVSVAAFMQQHLGTETSCCFTEFVDAEDPFVKLEGVWNPLIANAKQVKESISLGKSLEAHPNILLTGPHGSGKSSFMREVAFSVILSQIFGIALADFCSMTYLSVINTYFMVTDNIDKGMSTFMVSFDLMNTIERRILNLKDRRFGLTLIDEPVKDTFEAEASQLITNFGRAVAPVTENICILATHFTSPVDTLEQEYQSRFQNFHMDIQERTEGRFKRLFKLKEGKANWWFADHAQRDRYIKWLQTAAA